MVRLPQCLAQVKRQPNKYLRKVALYPESGFFRVRI